MHSCSINLFLHEPQNLYRRYNNIILIIIITTRYICMYSGLTIEEAEELSVEDMMEEHCEELQDEELLNTSLGNNNSSADSAAVEPKKKTAAAKRTKNKKSTLSDEGQGSSEATKEESEKWRPQSILTEWGRTDDIVTIGNGDQYYYFKIPHKARYDFLSIIYIL